MQNPPRIVTERFISKRLANETQNLGKVFKGKEPQPEVPRKLKELGYGLPRKSGLIY